MSRYRAPDADGTPFVQHRERALNLPQECARENTFVPAPRAHKKQPIDQRTHGRTESFSKRKHGSKLAFCRLIDRLSLQPAGAPCVNYHISFLDAGVRYAYPTSACLDQEGGGARRGLPPWWATPCQPWAHCSARVFARLSARPTSKQPKQQIKMPHVVAGTIHDSPVVLSRGKYEWPTQGQEKPEMLQI